jgi:uncharacterized protein YciI/uncharacterized protein YndB with AHSA1/START domain
MIEVPPIKKEISVKTSAARAFAIFTDGIDSWWPRQHHIGASPLKRTLIEPRVGGRWYSISEDGSECDVGRVLTWDPPNRLVLSWNITAEWTFDPSFVTEVEVRFKQVAPKQTAVSFEHRLLERYGAAGPEMRERMAAPEGWDVTFENFARVASNKAAVFYEASANVMQLAPLHFPAHKARLDAFHARGELIAVGPYLNPQDGSLAIFSDLTAAEAFVAQDPFVLEGVVAKYTVKEWREALL